MTRRVTLLCLALVVAGCAHIEDAPPASSAAPAGAAVAPPASPLGSPFGDYLTAAGFASLGAGFRLVPSSGDDPDDEDISVRQPPLRRGG